MCHKFVNWLPSSFSEPCRNCLLQIKPIISGIKSAHCHTTFGSSGLPATAREQVPIASCSSLSQHPFQVSLKKYAKLSPATFAGWQLGGKTIAVIRASGNITGAEPGGGLPGNGITANEVTPICSGHSIIHSVDARPSIESCRLWSLHASGFYCADLHSGLANYFLRLSCNMVSLQLALYNLA